jgi:hypothetical protein
LAGGDLVNAIEIVDAVRQHGATLALEGGRLVVQGAGAPMPAELRDELGAHKAEVMIALGCPIDRTVASIVADIRPHLPAALMALPDDRLLALVNWHIIAAFETAIRRLGER